jgi:DNA repair protein RecO
MHHIHRTKAFVLSSFPFGEAGLVLNLLTKDFGVLRVNAQGTRKSESKLRQSIQDFSLTDVAMVYGKKGWILTNASIETNYYYKLPMQATQSIARIFTLIQRMIPFEDPHEEIFTVTQKAIETMEKSPNSAKIVEISTVFEILHELGYIGEIGELEFEKIVGPDNLEYISENESEIIHIINNSIRESHL